MGLNLAAKRAAFDRVLAAAKAERTDLISLYDCAIWLMYTCARSEAINQAHEMEGDEPHTIAREIEDMMDVGGTRYEEDIEALGNQLDPDFEKPARDLVDWLN